MKSLLKVTRKAHLGLLLVSELALHQAGGAPLSLEEVARKTDASRKFLEQIAGQLRLAGIIRGVRGAGGGYRLMKDPASLTLAEVMDAVEGREIEDCTARDPKREAEIGILTKIQGQVVATLMNTTVADLVRV